MTRTDGRKQRSSRSREKIVAAIVELIQSGTYSPRAIDIAERTGLSMRSVFRHIDDMDSLSREITDDLEERLLPKFMMPFQAREWRDQLHEMVDRRAVLWEEVMPFRIHVSLRRFGSEFAMLAHRRLFELERARLAGVIPQKDQQDRVFFEALNQAMSCANWISMRTEQGLDTATCKTIVAMQVAQILAGLGDD